MSAQRLSHRAQRGVTLIELIVSIIVIALAGVALVSTLGYIASNSGSSMGDFQAQATADYYLAGELAKPFASLSNSNTVDGTLQVSIAVANSGALANVPAAAALRVDVTVTTPSGHSMIATGYRLLP